MRVSGAVSLRFTNAFRRRGRREARKKDRREKNGLLDRGGLLSDSLVDEPGGARARGKNAASRDRARETVR